MKQMTVDGILCTRYSDGAVTLFKAGWFVMDVPPGREADKTWFRMKRKGKKKCS
jgi:hypothetical protein